MTETELGERIARIEGAQEFMVSELRRARTFGRIAWASLAVVLVVVVAGGFVLGQVLVQECGWMS